MLGRVSHHLITSKKHHHLRPGNVEEVKAGKAKGFPKFGRVGTCPYSFDHLTFPVSREDRSIMFLRIS